jgi:glycosyltransferase involved in cell wall biosynthesis
VEVCTIIAKNYVASARVLARSLAEHDPEARLWTLIIDDFEGYIDPAEEPFEVLTPADIDCQPFTYMALRYSVLELSTAVKPWLLRHLMGETRGPVTYLDPDIEVHGSLRRLDELAALHGVVLTPHSSQPLPADGRSPTQIDVMVAGAYNLGYVSLAPRPEVEELLDWWSDRLRRDCRIDPIWGYFVDQRWFDLVPGFLTDFYILRDPEYNVAYWNMHSRRLEHDGERYLVDGRPLAFAHFSGFDPERPLSLSRHQNRIDVRSHPVLRRLLSEYAARVMGEGHAVTRKWPYTYVALGDGTQIDDFVRTFCEEYGDEQERSDHGGPSPFTHAGARTFEDWLREEGPEAPSGVNRVLARIYEDRGDLQVAFPDLTGPDRERLISWAEDIGSREVPLLAKVGGRTNGAGRPAPASAGRPLGRLGEGSWGVNVVGPFGARGELGEAARQIVGIFDARGTPSAPVLDSTAPFTDENEPFVTLPPEYAPFLVNVICTRAEALPEFARQAGEQFFAGRYSVGLAFCDLEPPAAAVSDAFAHVQEVWAPSTYAAGLLEPAAPVAVHAVPIPVNPPPLAPRSRAELGLPDGKFLFLFTLDRADDPERKNPLAIIEAFKRAFGPGDEVHLLITCLNPDAIEGLRVAAAPHPGVQVLEGPMILAESRAITALCDCYVSLHRAEAFGLAMAEAMWLGKPVIATGFSGNLDFMTAENSLLVDYRLVGAAPGAAGSVGTHARWADPDLDHAARLMQQVFEDPVSARALGDQAAADIRRTHSPTAAGEIIGRRLESIRQAGQARRGRARAHVRPVELSEVQARITQGPPPIPRGGASMRARALIRKVTLRAMRPYSNFQQKVNAGLAAALEAHIANLATGAAVERAQLLAELRGSRHLRTVVETHARGLDEVGRMMSLQSDRSLYLAIAELGRRHAAIATEPGERPEPLALTTFELRGYSQNGEDGVLAEILRRIGITNRFFVEFGVESGREGNCVYLADVAGWRGLFMEADDGFYRLLERKYQPQDDVRTIQARITHENIELLLAEGEVPQEPDVVSIDVDGQDYWIWEAIEGYRPRVVVIEYNSALDPHRRLVQPRESGASWDGTEYMGASLGAIQALGERKGYRLVHTELAGSNAFLVRADLAEENFPHLDEVSVRGVPNYFGSGYRHPPDHLRRGYVDLDTGEMAEAT